MNRDPITSSVRPINPERLRRMFDQPVDYARNYSILSDENEGIEEMLSDWRASGRRYVRAFAIAVAVFCIVYFGGQLVRGVL